MRLFSRSRNKSKAKNTTHHLKVDTGTSARIRARKRANTPVASEGISQQAYRERHDSFSLSRIVDLDSYTYVNDLPELPSAPIVPEAVPQAAKSQPVSFMRAFMPLIMVVMVIGMVGLMVASGTTINPMMLIFPLMMAMSAIMMFGSTPGEDIDEVRRTYLRHLSALRGKINNNAAAQREHELYHYPAPQHLWLMTEQPRLWAISAHEDRALAIRVGVGMKALCTPLSPKNIGAIEDLDPVCAVGLRRLIRSGETVTQLPIVIQLRAFPIVFLYGAQALDLMRAMIINLTYHHDPQTVAIAVYSTKLQWCKWLPHTYDVDNASYKILILDMDNMSLSSDEIHIVLSGQQWTSVLCFSEKKQNSLFLLKAEDEGLVLCVDEKIRVQTQQGEEEIATADCISHGEAELFARMLTKYRRNDQNESLKNELCSLLGIHECSPKELRRLWFSSERERLAVPIGLDIDGKPLIIDIKESAHGGMGPHGLCVGATGSGKSELLRTLVVAMAAAHSPEQLNFVLVDFKGGATFLGLEKLPHTSAVITNLEEESVLVERMYDAISGELHRRQELLRHAGNYANVGEYTKARETELAHKGHTDLEPLPALFIVVDEFSELLGQHPDFADLFVAVGRLGRSLHIHLLLASQRLDEGRLRGLDSHLSYRIGLKTFSSAESRQVLGIADAYQLPNTPGAGYCKTTSDELIRFQTAYVSGVIETLHKNEQQGDTYDSCNGEVSQTIQKVKLWQNWEDLIISEEQTRIADPHGRTLVDVLVEASTALAKDSGYLARAIWLPPLPKELALAEVKQAQGFLHVNLGIIDRPYHQSQDVFTIAFTGQNGHIAICGGPQTGKTTAVRSLLLGLCLTHTTEDIRFYILDLAGTALAQMCSLPHIAGIAHRYEEEKIRRTVDEVIGLIESPESRHTFLVVDGWHVLNSEYDDMLDKLAYIASDGLAARVHLIVTTPRWSSIRPVVRDLISQRIELKIGEALDSLIDRKAQQKLVALPGRGLTVDGENMLIALSANQDISYIAGKLALQAKVPQLKLLPEKISLNQLQKDMVPENEPQGIVLGLGGQEMEQVCWDHNTHQHLLCFGSQGSGKTTLLSTVIAGICNGDRNISRIVMLDHRRAHLGEIPEEFLAAYSANTAQSEKIISDLVTTLTQRLPPADITPAELMKRTWWTGPELFLLIDDLDMLPDSVMHPLLQLMAHSRDIGLHVVIARKVGGIQRALYQPFLSQIKDQSPMVLILDADKDDGVIFGVRPVHQIPGRAQWVQRGVHMGSIHIACAQDNAMDGVDSEFSDGSHSADQDDSTE
ncbi:type VII secretion protein EccCa [Corynebacterium sp. sy039]|uniref:type VII secretion protein EccCa n=1 Tax=Corynebacterium sp. sy039 TaxID=2599641 RepID=UPI0011B37BE7|nr:type VII secretion protein EccCa [Corynebacterium sp. sy039]QDZ42057.1 type VII secretion protein EccCa [Corynebacterium sp. sy039]